MPLNQTKPTKPSQPTQQSVRTIKRKRKEGKPGSLCGIAHTIISLSARPPPPLHSSVRHKQPHSNSFPSCSLCCCSFVLIAGNLHSNKASKQHTSPFKDMLLARAVSALALLLLLASVSPSSVSVRSTNGLRAVLASKQMDKEREGGVCVVVVGGVKDDPISHQNTNACVCSCFPPSLFLSFLSFSLSLFSLFSLFLSFSPLFFILIDRQTPSSLWVRRLTLPSSSTASDTLAIVLPLCHPRRVTTLQPQSLALPRLAATMVRVALFRATDKRQQIQRVSEAGWSCLQRKQSIQRHTKQTQQTTTQ